MTNKFSLVLAFGLFSGCVSYVPRPYNAGFPAPNDHDSSKTTISDVVNFCRDARNATLIKTYLPQNRLPFQAIVCDSFSPDHHNALVQQNTSGSAETIHNATYWGELYPFQQFCQSTSGQKAVLGKNSASAWCFTIPQR